MKKYIYITGGTLIFLAALVDFVGVISRFLALPSYDFGPNFSMWLLAWAVMLSAAPLVAEKGGHVAIMTIPKLFNKETQALLKCISVFATLTAATIVAYSGAIMTESLYRRDVQFSLMVDAPQYLVKLCIFIGMSLMVFYSARELLKGMSKPEIHKDTGEGL